MPSVIKSLVSVFALIAFSVLVSACSPEVGSKEWCDAMKEKPKGDWSTNELAEFTKNCVL
ncbi:DUF3012 domain-containing protein [Sneathiella aquimaris]|uniref:DUF3012 domain-containing protein n=1 Tax=Sneathiella sp. TaxID=1964365 RepID=UPI00146A5546